jgi:hypothetical protein
MRTTNANDFGRTTVNGSALERVASAGAAEAEDGRVVRLSKPRLVSRIFLVEGSQLMFAAACPSFLGTWMEASLCPQVCRLGSDDWSGVAAN